MTATTGGAMGAELAFSQAKGNLDMTLRDATGVAIAIADGTADTETIQHDQPRRADDQEVTARAW